MTNDKTDDSVNFIEKIVKSDYERGVKIATRFPPEPNGFLHLGHVKSICLNFEIAKKYGGHYNLRFDDTNPEKESDLYINSIKEDIAWLGYDSSHPLFASDYYEQMYKTALKLIKMGKAYVDTLTADEIRETRGTLTKPGVESKARNSSIEWNLIEFQRMKEGKYKEGERVLRAKIDMSSPNINMRDPVIYRIRFSAHPRTGNKWCIYPMYDLAHSIEDAIEGITHSLCTLEFEDHRPLYDWVCDNDIIKHHPRQIEFARLNVNYLVMSKRKLLFLVNNNYVDGWDDPRMPTIAGLRRRGFSPSSLKTFVQKVGIKKVESVIDYSLLEFCLRQELNKSALRVFAVIDPVKVIIDNYPADKSEEFSIPLNPEDPNSPSRNVTFSKEIYIQRSDFDPNPPKDFFRLSPGKEVRLKGGYFIKCNSYETDESGKISTLHCTYDPDTKDGKAPDGRKVKATIHYLSKNDSLPCEFRLYDKLFSAENPGEKTGNFLDDINKDSLKIEKGFIEKQVLKLDNTKPFQFVRNGYFIRDSKSLREDPTKLVFNRSVSLKDSFEKAKNKS